MQLHEEVLCWIAFIFTCWAVLAFLIMLWAANKIFPDALIIGTSRYILAGMMLGALAPISIILINENFDKVNSKDAESLQERLYKEQSAGNLNLARLEEIKNVSIADTQNYYVLRDYLKDLIVIFSAGVGGNLIASGITGRGRPDKQTEGSSE
jgi:hypothetical protein